MKKILLFIALLTIVAFPQERIYKGTVKVDSLRARTIMLNGKLLTPGGSVSNADSLGSIPANRYALKIITDSLAEDIANINGMNNGRSIYLGYQSGLYSINSLATGRNVGIGEGALEGQSLATWSATRNVAIGGFSLTRITSGTGNVAVGYLSGNLLTSGYENTFIGREAGTTLSGGNNNLAIGHEAMTGSVNGQYNISIGSYSARSLSSGSFNIDISSGNDWDGISTGSYNMTLGQYYANSLLLRGISNGIVQGGSNQIRLGTIISGVNSSDIYSFANIDINDTSKMIKITADTTKILGSMVLDGALTFPSNISSLSGTSVMIGRVNGEIRVQDASGNETVISPHPKEFDGKWMYMSEKDGEYTVVDWEEFIKSVETITGKKFLYKGSLEEIKKEIK